MTLLQIRPTASRLHYAWIILAVTFLVVVVTVGVRATPSVLIVPLEEEFHWSRATISFALGINLLLYGAIGPFAAAVMDRFGARRTMTLALVATTAGVALTLLMNQPWQLVLLWGVVVGLSTGFIGGYLAAYIAARWFRTHPADYLRDLSRGLHLVWDLTDCCGSDGAVRRRGRQRRRARGRCNRGALMLSVRRQHAVSSPPHQAWGGSIHDGWGLPPISAAGRNNSAAVLLPSSE